MLKPQITQLIGPKERKLPYQAPTEVARARALLFTHYSATADAVVDKFVLLSKTLADMSTWKHDRQPVLPLFIIEANKLVFLFC